MVQAKVNPERVQVVEPENIDLIGLSREEAQALADIMACVGGSPSKSGRRFTDAIGQALKAQGFKPTNLNDETFPFEPNARALFFKDDAERQVGLSAHPWDGDVQHGDEPPF